ncbi:MAG: TRAP transporter small permease subunit [Spirochaetales bacterium]|jgi:TRAP-type C4-dicarboxylate transport system permease small subunit|nr:TRAP transporter small permease subunit [Spirochaetales bacterium]
MKLLKTVYHGVCVLEEALVSLFVALITFFVFISAVARSFDEPLNWAQDICLLLFAWVVFLGADLALRKAEFVRVEMLVMRFSAKTQKFLYYLMYIISIVFLLVLVRYGIPLSIENSKRLFQTLGISYSWATISAPVGSVLLCVTIILKLIAHRKDEKIIAQGKEAI